MKPEATKTATQQYPGAQAGAEAGAIPGEQRTFYVKSARLRGEPRMPCCVKTKRAWRSNRRTIIMVGRAVCCQNNLTRQAENYVENGAGARSRARRPRPIHSPRLCAAAHPAVRTDLDLISTIEDPNLRLGNIGDDEDQAVMSRNRALAQSNLRGSIFFITSKNGTVEEYAQVSP